MIINELLQKNQPTNRFNGMHVWHGTSNEGSAAIMKHGVDISKSTGGYFGYGFYCADNPELAKSNYADWANDDGESGAVLEFQISNNARILDLVDENDWLIWRDSGWDKNISDPNLYKKIVAKGIDGVYDRSFDGICFYNPKVLKFIKIL